MTSKPACFLVLVLALVLSVVTSGCGIGPYARVCGGAQPLRSEGKYIVVCSEHSLVLSSRLLETMNPEQRKVLAQDGETLSSLNQKSKATTNEVAVLADPKSDKAHYIAVKESVREIKMKAEALVLTAPDFGKPIGKSTFPPLSTAPAHGCGLDREKECKYLLTMIEISNAASLDVTGDDPNLNAYIAKIQQIELVARALCKKTRCEE